MIHSAKYTAVMKRLLYTACLQQRTFTSGRQQAMSNQQTVKVCDLDDIPDNDMRCVSLADRNVVVAKTEAGVFVADEMCTHEDARLCDGNLNGTKIKCPLHGSRFDLLTGKVLDDPADEDLVTYPVTLIDNAIHITIER